MVVIMGDHEGDDGDDDGDGGADGAGEDSGVYQAYRHTLDVSST